MAPLQDASTSLRHSESGMIDSVLVTTGADGQRFVKMRVRAGCRPVCPSPSACRAWCMRGGRTHASHYKLPACSLPAPGALDTHPASRRQVCIAAWAEGHYRHHLYPGGGIATEATPACLLRPITVVWLEVWPAPTAHKLPHAPASPQPKQATQHCPCAPVPRAPCRRTCRSARRAYLRT